jgi:hypothetical protein
MDILDRYAKRAEAHTNHKDRQSHQGAERMLRAMICHAPTVAGQETVRHAITLCSSDDKLLELSTYYFNGLIRPSEFAHQACYKANPDSHDRPVKALGSVNPTVSEHPSRLSTEMERDINASPIESAKHDQATLKILVSEAQGFLDVPHTLATIDRLYVAIVSAVWSHMYMTKVLFTRNQNSS